MEAWFKFKNKEVVTPGPNEIIWRNSKIKIEGKTIMCQEPFSKGLIYLSQLVQEHKFISCRTAIDKFGLSLMQYNSLISAISPSDRKELKECKQESKLGNTFYKTTIK